MTLNPPSDLSFRAQPRNLLFAGCAILIRAADKGAMNKGGMNQRHSATNRGSHV